MQYKMASFRVFELLQKHSVLAMQRLRDAFIVFNQDATVYLIPRNWTLLKKAFLFSMSWIWTQEGYRPGYELLKIWRINCSLLVVVARLALDGPLTL